MYNFIGHFKVQKRASRIEISLTCIITIIYFTVVKAIHTSKWNQNCNLDLSNMDLTLVYTYSMISMVVPRPLPLGFGLVVVLDFPGLGLTLTCGLRTPLTTPRPLNGYPRSYITKSRQCHVTCKSFVYA